MQQTCLKLRLRQEADIHTFPTMTTVSSLATCPARFPAGWFLSYRIWMLATAVPVVRHKPFLEVEQPCRDPRDKALIQPHRSDPFMRLGQMQTEAQGVAIHARQPAIAEVHTKPIVAWSSNPTVGIWVLTTIQVW